MAWLQRPDRIFGRDKTWNRRKEEFCDSYAPFGSALSVFSYVAEFVARNGRGLAHVAVRCRPHRGFPGGPAKEA